MVILAAIVVKMVIESLLTKDIVGFFLCLRRYL